MSGMFSSNPSKRGNTHTGRGYITPYHPFYKGPTGSLYMGWSHDMEVLMDREQKMDKDEGMVCGAIVFLTCFCGAALLAWVEAAREFWYLVP